MNTALLIIDMQNDLVKPEGKKVINNAESIVSSVAALLKCFRKCGKTVIHVIRQYRSDGCDVEKFILDNFLANPYLVPGTWGAEIVDELKPQPSEIILIKNRFSAFMGTELDLVLRRKRIDNLLIAGIQYPNCIRATVFDAISLDYSVDIIYECAAAASKEVEQANICDLQSIGVNFLYLNEYITK